MINAYFIIVTLFITFCLSYSNNGNDNHELIGSDDHMKFIKWSETHVLLSLRDIFKLNSFPGLNDQNYEKHEAKAICEITAKVEIDVIESYFKKVERKQCTYSRKYCNKTNLFNFSCVNVPINENGEYCNNYDATTMIPEVPKSLQETQLPSNLNISTIKCSSCFNTINNCNNENDFSKYYFAFLISSFIGGIVFAFFCMGLVYLGVKKFRKKSQNRKDAQLSVRRQKYDSSSEKRARIPTAPEDYEIGRNRLIISAPPSS